MGEDRQRQETERQARLAEALRTNLRRRKQQSRERAGPDDGTGEGAG